MLTRPILWRVVGPTLLVSLMFLVSCITAAALLSYRQAESVRALDEDIQSRLIADELLESLHELVRSLIRGDRPGRVEALHRQIPALLAEANAVVDTTDEARLVGGLQAIISRYFQLHEHQDNPQGPSDDRPTLRVLEQEALPAARELDAYHARAIERSQVRIHSAATWMAWGLAGVGLVGASAGLMLGYVATRGLNRAVLRAEEMAEVGQLAAGMAHEIRNPLTAIKMLVQANLEDAEQQGLPTEDLRVIEQEIRRMEDRLNGFIDYARPPRPERHPTDLARVVEQTLALIAGRARKQDVALRFDRPAAPHVIEADAEQIRQLLVNLALNALDVMPRGGLLEFTMRPVADGLVELDVIDSGPGIPRRHLPRLYEPFFTSKATGLGLGLVVSQRIARNHGGHLRASNRPEGGACFTLRIPASRPPAS